MADKHHANRTLLDIEILNVHPVLQAVVDRDRADNTGFFGRMAKRLARKCN